MGRKNHKKAGQRKAARRPDDVRVAGPLVMARYGTHVVLSNNMTKAEHDEWLGALAGDFPKLCAHINQVVADIRAEIAKYSPLNLLARAGWACGLAVMKDTYGRPQEARARLFIEYVQSVCASTASATTIVSDIGEVEFNALNARVQELYDLLTGPYSISHSAYKQATIHGYDKDRDALDAELTSHWLLVTGARHHVHEIIHIRELLQPHDALLRRCLGAGASEIVATLEAILDASAHGFARLWSDIDDLHKECRAIADQLENNGIADPTVQQVTSQVPNWDARQDSVAARMNGPELFRIPQPCPLPSTLLDRLSYQPGEDTEFFVAGEHSGWPLRELPSRRRPLLRVANEYYCFNVHSLFDHIYRVIESAVIDADPTARSAWERVQRRASEQMTYEYVRRLLPSSARMFGNVFYSAPVQGSAALRPCECDLVIECDTCLIVVETKGGGVHVLISRI